MRITKAIAARIRTAQDLGDLFAYFERWGDELVYSFPASEQDRIDALMDDICYTMGYYDAANVARMLGGKICAD